MVQSNDTMVLRQSAIPESQSRRMIMLYLHPTLVFLRPKTVSMHPKTVSMQRSLPLSRTAAFLDGAKAAIELFQSLRLFRLRGDQAAQLLSNPGFELKCAFHNRFLPVIICLRNYLVVVYLCASQNQVPAELSTLKAGSQSRRGVSALKVEHRLRYTCQPGS